MKPANLEAEFHSNREKLVLNIDNVSQIIHNLKTGISSNNSPFELKIPYSESYPNVLMNNITDSNRSFFRIILKY